MKSSIIFFIVFCTTFLLSYGSAELRTELTNQTIPTSKEVSRKMGTYNVIQSEYAVITFISRTGENAELTRVEMEWHGPHLKNFTASLFEKMNDSEPIHPTEDHFIADGKWNEKTQRLTFTFKKIPLFGTTRFSLIITAPLETIDILKQGILKLISESLPRAFQLSAQSHNIIAPHCG